MSIRARSSRYFAAAMISAAISFVTLPLTTRVLGPHDYGVFSLAATLSGAGAWISATGAGYVLANRWNPGDADERTVIASTLTWLAAAVAFVWSGLFLVGFLLLRDDVGILGSLPLDGTILAVVATVIGAPWAVASTTLMLEGRASVYSAVTVLQATATAAATLVALFVFDAGTLALFVGVLAGGVVSFAAGLAVLLQNLAPRFDLMLARETTRLTFVLSQGFDALQPVLERVLMSRFAGFANLGLYNHSQRYAQVVQQASKSVSRGVWPATLAEARDLDGDFPATRRTWNVIHVGITAVGIAATAFGDVFISALTNDRFTEAHVYLAPWFAILLLQSSAKPEVGALYALGPGKTVARLSLTSTIVGVLVTVVLVPLAGASGAVAALVIQAVVYRLVVRRPARRLRSVPFQDGWALYGIAILAVVFAAKVLLDADHEASAAVLVAAELALLLPALGVVRETRRLLPSWLPGSP